MKKISECKKGDRITIVSPDGAITQDITIIGEDRLYMDEIPFYNNCPIIDNYFCVVGETIYFPVENFTKLMKFYNTAFEHGESNLKKTFKKMLDIK